MGRVGDARSEPVGRVQRVPGGGVQGLELGGWDVAEGLVQAGGVEPGDPLDDRELELGAVAPDAVFFDLAVAAGCQEQWDDAEGLWRACLEAGDMKAHFGLGYTLVELGRPREAYGHLVTYTELTPALSWAWFWRGRAAEEMGELEDARTCYGRALDAEEAGSEETDAAEHLAALHREAT